VDNLPDGETHAIHPINMRIEPPVALITASATPVPAVSGKNPAAPAEKGIAGLSHTVNSLDRSVSRYDFFIAYATPDRQQAQDLCWHLQDQSCKVFLDVEDLSPGASWPLALQAALEASRAIVVLVSTHADNILGCYRECSGESPRSRLTPGPEHSR
jgi:hypothetical protein